MPGAQMAFNRPVNNSRNRTCYSGHGSQHRICGSTGKINCHRPESNMGRRDELWVAIQFGLLILFLVIPSSGKDWPHVMAFRVTGGLFLITGIVMPGWSVGSLGRAFTPFPRPADNSQLVSTGGCRVVCHPIYLGVLLDCTGFAIRHHQYFPPGDGSGSVCIL